jgi:Uma2 family endonuclease
MATEQLPRADSEYEPSRRVSVEDYLRLSRDSLGKYEYAGGLMYPRFYPPGSYQSTAGGTRAHGRLMLRIAATLDAHLRHSPCNAYPSDMRLAVSDDTYFYPDAFVVCNEDMEPNRIDIRDAVLVVEVRSESTSSYDQGDKFLGYRQLPSLREYLLLDNRRIQATLFRLDDDGEWRYVTFTGATTLTLATVSLQVPLAELYEGVPLDRDPMNPL